DRAAGAGGDELRRNGRGPWGAARDGRVPPAPGTRRVAEALRGLPVVVKVRRFMPCDRAAQVQAYYDGRLTAQSRHEFEDHLRSCGECAKLLAELHGLSRLIAAAPRARVS